MENHDPDGRLVTGDQTDREEFSGVGTSVGREAKAVKAPLSERMGLPGVITRQKYPDNVEFPFWTLDRFLTPDEQFYVRTHFEVPNIDRRTWTLKVEGEVEKPLEIGFDELIKMPTCTLPALLECSGNGRAFLPPPQSSIRWELGAVGTAEWTGVRLSDVLKRSGVKTGAVEVLLEGADRGEFRMPDAQTPGVIHYSRSLPLEKAHKPEVILAFRMNGKDLSPAHGYPVRAVVPGWYGMASVKWLTRIAVLDEPFHGYFQTFVYAIWRRQQGQPSLEAVTDIHVKSQIARPMEREVVPAGRPYYVFGAAWAGEEDVTKVEVSTNGGNTWTSAELTGEAKPFCWRFWEYEWETPQPGKVTLMARATDSKGRTQPTERDDDRRDAVITHPLPVTVEVR